MKHHKLRDKLRDCIFPFVLPLLAVKIKYKVNVINKCNIISDNLLMLPMRWGIIETAYTAGAQIIPMALMYDRDKKECYAKFSEPIYGEQLTDCRNGIQLLRDSIATLRYELMEECGKVQPRYILQSELWQKENKDIIAEYPPLDWQYEKSVIYKG